ncbi:P-loop containing nucleoside triphosphate hydrolase protein [Cylindrobasidium torrendii FP15055 ss-10]|uniref:p-loop containing nucleoside triphosphate hydrolase protein n=1 Tax=Cylindrobasidium torrendii FP15055 ss-10 TaxID=1314674 RepID=A0A0D7BSF2_9AGAR|nr:P-loop containing nucleoside triphosphate hydrolase protein [Cylindrobasidium torrendii FP15055 ss-10]
MRGVFWTQLTVLFWKNWIVLAKHPYLNILRCFVLPIAYGIFLAVAQIFLSKPSNFGIGSAVPIRNLNAAFTDTTLTLVWADRTTGNGTITAEDIVSPITRDFTPSQRNAVRRLDSPDDIVDACPQNFNLFSECFAAIVFNDLPDNGPINYTIRADGGLFHIDVEKHTSDFELRVLPLQWAIDNAIMSLRTGQDVQTPMEWPFTQITNEEQATDIRLSYIRGLRTLLVIALFVCWVGIAYRLPGALASWSLFVAAPFGKSPQLAAVTSTLLAIVFAIIALAFSQAGNGAAFVYTIVFPPGYYIFVIRAICGWENHLLPTEVLRGDPDNGLTVLPILIAAIIDIFLWPWLAVLLENYLYDAKNPVSRRRWLRSRVKEDIRPAKPGVAISLTNLNKTFKTSFFARKNTITAVEDLTLDIPKNGIFVLLGSNGAGKSTVLSILGGLAGRTSGTVQFENGKDTPEHGMLSIVPQKNVLFPELTCLQTLRVWRAVTWSKHSRDDEDMVQLLKDCDLAGKIHANASTLSGGQKRKLQLAIGLVGGSKTILVDECTSGVDPLSRRAIWRTLTACRLERTIVFTTHFLDEADLLADNIAILAAPGKLVASGSPVSLKRDLGEGYTIQATVQDTSSLNIEHILEQVQSIAPSTITNTNSEVQIHFHLRTKDNIKAQRVLELFESLVEQSLVVSFDILGTSIEDIFLDLMDKNDPDTNDEVTERDVEEKESLTSNSGGSQRQKLELSAGKPMPVWKQACTIFVKRYMIVRRSWLAPFLAIVVAVAGSTIPLVFLSDRQATCERTFRRATTYDSPLYAPISPYAADTGVVDGIAQVLNSPPGLLTSSLGSSIANLSIAEVQDNTTFVNSISNSYRSFAFGGLSMDMDTGATLFAWEASTPGYNGLVLLNLASNILYNRALNASGVATPPAPLIQANYAAFPPAASGTLVALKWVAFFGATMSVYTAFFSLYVSAERRSAVQAMQFSNGLANPLGLWVGHLLFDSIFSLIPSSIIIIVLAAASNQFHALGFFWLVMVLYGLAGTLLAYCISLFVSSPLAAFAAAAGYQVIMFVLYLAGYLLTYTYAKTSAADRIITTIHFTLSLLSPVASVLRAAFVSVNLFSLLCSNNSPTPDSQAGDIMRFGGPILYLIVQCFGLVGLLLWVDSGASFSRLFARRTRRNIVRDEHAIPEAKDVAAEAERCRTSDDVLRVTGISKTYGKNKVVDNVSLSVSDKTIFALLGPNGAGKTTTFNVIRGDVVPDGGDVLVAGESILSNPQRARFSLGVCPQFTAIDSQLTVREHLHIYGRLKGLGSGSNLRDNIDNLLRSTNLGQYADRLASKLSGGNQRKLSLAIALIGNPSVVLVDEFSTGVDARMKRSMWKTLRAVAVGKGVVITTHSMEEASALANKVGILAKRMLTVGTTESLSARYSSYEVHFSCRTREDVIKAQTLMAKIPDSRMSDDVATRFEVPIRKEFPLSQLFQVLASSGEFSEYTVEKATLENVFLKVIKASDVAQIEED